MDLMETLLHNLAEESQLVKVEEEQRGIAAKQVLLNLMAENVKEPDYKALKTTLLYKQRKS